MDYARLRKRIFLSHLIIQNFALMASATEPAPPGFFRVFKDRFQCLVVASYAVVLIKPPQLAAEGFVLRLDGIVAVCFAPEPQHFHEAVLAFSCRHLFDRPTAL